MVRAQEKGPGPMRSAMWSSLIIKIIVLAGISPLAFGMPKDLEKARLDLGCEPIRGFYERDGRIEPEYLNLHDGRPAIDSRWKAVFWCKPKTKPKAYWLVFVVDGLPYQQDGCSPILEWNAEPRGLAVHSQKLPLSSLYDLTKKTPAASKGLTSYAPISDVYDGAGHAFYCYNKKWYVAPLH